jgi:hypothetical protein
MPVLCIFDINYRAAGDAKATTQSGSSRIYTAGTAETFDMFPNIVDPSSASLPSF